MWLGMGIRAFNTLFIWSGWPWSRLIICSLILFSQYCNTIFPFEFIFFMDFFCVFNLIVNLLYLIIFVYHHALLVWWSLYMYKQCHGIFQSGEWMSSDSWFQSVKWTWVYLGGHRLLYQLCGSRFLQRRHPSCAGLILEKEHHLLVQRTRRIDYR